MSGESQSIANIELDMRPVPDHISVVSISTRNRDENSPNLHSQMNSTFSPQDPSLFRQQAFVAGRWCDADNGATAEVNNPATGEVLGRVPYMGRDETRRAIEAAKDSWAGWREMPAKDRSAILRRWHDLMLANVDDLGKLMTAEQGKPLAEAKGEVAYAAGFMEWFAEEAKRVYSIFPLAVSLARSLELHTPRRRTKPDLQ
jgi:delta 1-pyrroline-5-carboxylate dehydrogenase